MSDLPELDELNADSEEVVNQYLTRIYNTHIGAEPIRGEDGTVMGYEAIGERFTISDVNTGIYYVGERFENLEKIASISTVSPRLPFFIRWPAR